MESDRNAAGLKGKPHPRRSARSRHDDDFLRLAGYRDDDGACYVTIFAGPKAEQRARDYFNALKSGTLKTARYRPAEH